MGKKRKRILSSAHYLLSCRFDNWIRLLFINRFSILPSKLPQALFITLMSLVLFPFALLEALIFAIPIRRSTPTRDPVFILGHWRSGTTFLQNLMSRDPSLAWCDPVNTNTFNNSFLLGWLLKGAEAEALKGARPMDNMRYALDLPMEETFAVATFSPFAIIHMMSFPKYFLEYMPSAFVDDLPPRKRRSWERAYMYMIRKMTYAKRGRRLLLKSPDNTCRIGALKKMFPDARYVNIHRDPYVTIMSTINMFRKQMEILALSGKPDGDFDELLEDTIIGIFERMYAELFAAEKDFPKNRYVEIAYDELCSHPLSCMEKIYDTLELDSYDDALPYFDDYIESMRDYSKNRFELDERLKNKVNARLGFYFEHYGYEMEA